MLLARFASCFAQIQVVSKCAFFPPEFQKLPFHPQTSVFAQKPIECHENQMEPRKPRPYDCPIMLYATLRTTNLFLFISFLLCSSITAVLLFHSHVNCRLAWRDTLLRFSPTPQPAAFPASCRSQRDPRHKRPGFIISHLGLPCCGSEHHVHPIIRHVKATVVERFCELKELLGKCHWATSSLVCCQFILGLFKK